MVSAFLHVVHIVLAIVHFKTGPTLRRLVDSCPTGLNLKIDSDMSFKPSASIAASEAAVR
jgi:hypothetical protein